MQNGMIHQPLFIFPLHRWDLGFSQRCDVMARGREVTVVCSVLEDMPQIFRMIVARWRLSFHLKLNKSFINQRLCDGSIICSIRQIGNTLFRASNRDEFDSFKG